MHRCRGIQRSCGAYRTSGTATPQRGARRVAVDRLTTTSFRVPDAFYAKHVPVSLLVLCTSQWRRATKCVHTLFSCVEVTATLDCVRTLHSAGATLSCLKNARLHNPFYFLRLIKKEGRVRCPRRTFSTLGLPPPRLKSSCSWLRRHCATADLVAPLHALAVKGFAQNCASAARKGHRGAKAAFCGEHFDAAHLLQGVPFPQPETNLFCFYECARCNFEATGWIADSLLTSYLSTTRPYPTPMLTKCIMQITPENARRLSTESVALLLKTTLSWEWHESEFEGNAKLFAHVLSLCDEVLSSHAVCEQLYAFGYEFEHLAYLSRQSRTIHELPRCRCLKARKGFGDYVLAVLECHSDEVNAAAHATALAAKMSAPLRSYFLDLLVLSHMRRAREKGNHHFFPNRIRTDYADPLELASHLHFGLRVGNRHTASLLLPHCTTREQIMAVMRHTHDAGRPLSLEALSVLLSKGLIERAYLSVRVTPRHPHNVAKSYHLLFEVEKRPLVPQEEDEDGGLEDLYPLAEPHKARDGVPSDGGALLDPRHVHEWSAHVKARAISTLIEAGQIWEAVNVLRQCASRSVLPEMKTLLLLLEKTQDNEEQLRECISLLKEEYRAVAPAVSRAFVERMTRRLQARDGGLAPLSRADSVRLIGSLSLLGSLYFPAQCLSLIGELAPTSLVKTVLQMCLASEQTQCRPAPLHIGVIEKLLEAAETIGLDVDFDVVLPPSAESAKCWWQSHGTCSQSSVITRLYCTQCTGLWFVARDLLGCGARLGHFDVQRALALIMLGCDDGPSILRIVKQQEDKLLQKAMPSASSHRQLRDLGLARTIGCVAECLTAKGHWECALQLLPASDSAPQILRWARLRALRNSPALGDLARVALKGEEASLCQESRGERPVGVFQHFYFPPRLEKMITYSDVGKSFFSEPD